MIEDTVKFATLKRITESESFSNADKYSTLLTYLVKSTLDGNVPKEYSIAVDVFERDKDFNPSEDTIVRYYMHRLRQKIATYYEDEGKNDEIRLVIPKGHYEVKFQPKPKITGVKNKLKQYGNYILAFLIIIFFSSSVFYFYQYHTLKRADRIIENSIEIDDPLWSSFFDNKLPTTLLIGDHFLIQEYDKESGGYREQIDYSIHTEADFNQFVNLHPERKLLKHDHGSLPHNSIFNLHDIENVFYSFYNRPDIQFTSEYMSKPTDLPKIVDRNIIYMGGFRNLRQFSQIIANLPIEYEYTDTFRGEIRIRDAKLDSLVTFKGRKLDEGRYLDLGFIAKLPGPNLENYLFFIGFAYPSQIETVRMACRRESLLKLYAQTTDQSNFPEYFFMVVEVTSFEYIAQETNIKYFAEFIKE